MNKNKGEIRFSEHTQITDFTVIHYYLHIIQYDYKSSYGLIFLILELANKPISIAFKKYHLTLWYEMYFWEIHLSSNNILIYFNWL